MTRTFAIVVALLFNALLIDAAVETSVSGSLVSMLVVLIATVHGVVSVGAAWYVRQRPFPWAALAGASGLVFVGMLAVTAWQPGGLSDGVRVMGLPTSVTLSIVSALALVVAGISLVRTRFLPLWGRSALSLIALYGVVAFVLGAARATPYADLLSGSSVWRQLPSWLQGAWIGAVIALPLAVIGSGIAAWNRARTAEKRPWGLQQNTALLLSAAIPLAAITESGRAASLLPTASEVLAPLKDSYRDASQALLPANLGARPAPSELHDWLERVFPIVEKMAQDIPRDLFDLEAVIAAVGRDPDTLFKWARDNTYLVPYRGILRGEKGVLLDRLGNSLDRAMVLQALLRSAGHRVRLARGRLTEGQARQVLARARPFPDHASRTERFDETAEQAAIARYADHVRADAGTLRASVVQVRQNRERVTGLAQKRSELQARLIAEAVGYPASTPRLREGPDTLAALADHWWVQWDRNSSWIDLDPTLPDAVVGNALTEVASVVQADGLDDLDAELIHTLQIRLVIEVRKDGEVTELPVLTHTVLPATIVGQSLTLRQVPTSWPQDLDLTSQRQPLEHFRETALRQREWLPVLSVGSQTYSKYSFNEHGDLSVASPPSLGQGSAALGSSIGGMLSASTRSRPSSSASSSPKNRGQVTAQWIDYEIRAPGRLPRVVRREVFDCVGPSQRNHAATAFNVDSQCQLSRALQLLGDTEILPLGWDVSSAQVDALIAENLQHNRQALLELVKHIQTKSRQGIAQALDRIQPLTRLYHLALTRARSRRLQETYLDQINVLTMHKFLTATRDGGLASHEGFDIVANGVAARADADTYLARIEQGTLDGAIEAFLACGGTATACADFSSASETLARQPDAVVIRHPQDAAWQRVVVSEDVRARMNADLASGRVVLVPAGRGVSGGTASAWWSVDPSTGETLAMGNRGWGQTSTEMTMIMTVSKLFVAGILFATCLAVRADPQLPGDPHSPRFETPMGETDLPWSYVCEVGKCGLTLGFVLVGMLIDSLLAVFTGGAGSMTGLLLPSCTKP